MRRHDLLGGLRVPLELRLDVQHQQIGLAVLRRLDRPSAPRRPVLAVKVTPAADRRRRAPSDAGRCRGTTAPGRTSTRHRTPSPARPGSPPPSAGRPRAADRRRRSGASSRPRPTSRRETRSSAPPPPCADRMPQMRARNPRGKRHVRRTGGSISAHRSCDHVVVLAMYPVTHMTIAVGSVWIGARLWRRLRGGSTAGRDRLSLRGARLADARSNRQAARQWGMHSGHAARRPHQRAHAAASGVPHHRWACLLARRGDHAATRSFGLGCLTHPLVDPTNTYPAHALLAATRHGLSAFSPGHRGYFQTARHRCWLSAYAIRSRRSENMREMRFIRFVSHRRRCSASPRRCRRPRVY